MMLGQERLQNRLLLSSLNDLPHTILLIGDDGCGKHFLASEMSKHYNLDLIDISDNISLETIEEIMMKPIPAFYLIDSSKITDRQQNVILKFLEEPNQYAYIIMIAKNKSYLLDTIINRCVSYEFETYSREHWEKNKFCMKSCRR